MIASRLLPDSGSGELAISPLEFINIIKQVFTSAGGGAMRLRLPPVILRVYQPLLALKQEEVLHWLSRAFFRIATGGEKVTKALGEVVSASPDPVLSWVYAGNTIKQDTASSLLAKEALMRTGLDGAGPTSGVIAMRRVCLAELLAVEYEISQAGGDAGLRERVAKSVDDLRACGDLSLDQARIAEFVAESLGDTDRALAVALEFQQAHPGDAWPHIAKGSLAERRGCLADAELCYAKAVALDPDDEHASRALALVRAKQESK